AGYLREPVVHPAEQRKDRGAEDDEVEMRDDEVRVGQRLVERNGGEHDPGQPTEDEERDEAADEKERRGEDRSSRDDRDRPREDLDRARDYDHHRGGGEKDERDRRQPGREHVVSPDPEADERDEQLGERDERECDHLAPRERRDDGRRDPKRR